MPPVTKHGIYETDKKLQYQSALCNAVIVQPGFLKACQIVEEGNAEYLTEVPQVGVAYLKERRFKP